jgi:hypothetical protein
VIARVFMIKEAPRMTVPGTKALHLPQYIEAVEELYPCPTKSPNKGPRSESPSTDEEQVVDSDYQ